MVNETARFGTQGSVAPATGKADDKGSEIFESKVSTTAGQISIKFGASTHVPPSG